jgi:hypothetical protein
MFPTGYLNAPGPIAGGEIHGGSHVILSSNNFENGLVVGRFAKVETGSAIHNIDGSATPVIAGVVQREANQPLDKNGVIDSTLTDLINYVTQGVVSVDAVTGQTPVRGAAIYAYNAAGTPADHGKATTTSTDNALTTAKFVAALSTNVWLVQLT